MTIIVDASVALKWVIREVDSDSAICLLSSDDPIMAPDLLMAEVGNAIWRHCVAGRLSRDIALAAMAELHRFLPETTSASDFSTRALDIALELQHPVYDCIYLAMAEQFGTLITADRRLLARLAGTPWAPRARPLVA